MNNNLTDNKRTLLGIVLPTYNNPESIEYILNRLKNYSEKDYDYVLSIFDSSTNEDTKNVVDKYASKNTEYHFVDSETNVDEKTLIAVKQSEAKYIFLIGDRYCPNLDVIFSEIDFEGNQNEIIALYDNKWKPQKNYYDKLTKFKFTDKNEFFRLHFWQLILYGGSICKRELISEINLEEMVSAFNGSGFIYPASLATYSSGPFESKCGDFIELVPYKTVSGWIKNKDAIRIWAKNIYDVSNKLDGALNKECVDGIIKTTGKNTEFLTAKGIASFKCDGNFNYAIYKKYKFYINRCRACSKLSIILILIIPVWLMKFSRKVHRKFIKFIRKSK